MPENPHAISTHRGIVCRTIRDQLRDFASVGTGTHILVNLARDIPPVVNRDIRIEADEFNVTADGLAVACKNFTGFMSWERLNALSGMLFYHLPTENPDAPQNQAETHTP